MNLNPFKFVKRLIYRLVLSELCISLIDSWKMKGSEWSYDHYHLTHKKSKMRLWVANGRWFFNVCKDNGSDHEGSSPIGLFERHLLWNEYNTIMKATRKAKAKKLHDDLIAQLKSEEVVAEVEDNSPQPAPKRTRRV
jgi:hypothetical protein